MVKGEITTSTLGKAAILVVLFLVLMIFPGKMQDAWSNIKIAFGADDADSLYDSGVKNYLKGDYSAANKKFNTFIDIYPGHPNATAALIQIAMAQAGQGNQVAADKVINQILKTDNLPGEVANPIRSQQQTIASSDSYDWGCVNYGSAGCIYGIKVNTDPCSCRMGVE